jgi:hypothetical protein
VTSAQLLRPNLVSKREQIVLWKEANVYSIPPRALSWRAFPGEKSCQLFLPKKHLLKLDTI